jgi:hypothetical protein
MIPKYLAIPLLLILISCSTENENRLVNRPESGEIEYSSDKLSTNELESDEVNPPVSKPLIKEAVKKEPVDPYADWQKASYASGDVPKCSNFTPKFDAEMDNYLGVKVGSNTDVAVKLCRKSDDTCVRYVYVRRNSTYQITNIPEGRYYLKIAYGKDWRQTVENGICKGKFTQNALYEKGVDILNYNVIYGEKIETYDGYEQNYQVPSYVIELDVVSNSPFSTFTAGKISEDQFNS